MDIVILVVVGLAISHAFEPDHIVTMRLMKEVKDYAIFGISHGIGFLFVAIPLVLLLSAFKFLEFIGDLIGLFFSFLLLYSELVGKEIEINFSKSAGSGILQGAFAITPSKIIVAVLASEAGLLLGSIYVLVFVFLSSLMIFLAGYLISKVSNIKIDVSKFINIAIALITIIYILYTIII